jgi:hypothetical protein
MSAVLVFISAWILTLELGHVGGAAPLLHEAAEGLLEEAVVVEDVVEVDVVVLGGVLGLGLGQGEGGRHQGGEYQQHKHRELLENKK